MYHTGLDPFTKKPVTVAKNMRDRKLQRALTQFFKPENYFEVREALLQAGRGDLIGNGCDCLIPAQPPKEVIEARRRANQKVGGETEGDHYHTVASPTRGKNPGERGAGPSKPTGYRPGRKRARRQDRGQKHKGGASGARP